MRTSKIVAIVGAAVVTLGIGFAAGVGVKSAEAQIKPVITVMPPCIDGFTKTNEKNGGLTYECTTKAPVCGPNYSLTMSIPAAFTGGIFKYGCERKPAPPN